MTDADQGATRPLTVFPPPPQRPSATEAGRPAGSTGAHAARKDIQGLRAIAVALVVAYHLRPDKLPGGFVGVDVFLVISGFLIVGSLSREATATGTIRLRNFYARRIRRLLPASSLVLVGTTVATLLLMPPSRWLTTAQGVVFSALQVQNWALAATTGYGSATAAVSPLQHYWSLAVEEQFYLVIPLLLLLACALAGRLGRSRLAAITTLIGIVVLASFAHSVVFSQSSHDVAYFATTTRMWELALGGLLALALAGPRLRIPGPLARAGVWVGLAMIAFSAVRLTTTMAFPGWIAAVPVVGSALVLLGGSVPGGRRTSVAGRLLGCRPMVYVGDISYSLYLWHWPVIVVVTFLTRRTPTKLDCVALVLGCLLLAALSTRFVERPFRSGAGSRHRRVPRQATPRRAFALAAVLLVGCLLAGAGPWVYVDHRTAALVSQRLDAEHPGAAAALPERLPAPSGVSVIPDPSVAGADIPLVNRKKDCASYDPRKTAPGGCVFGSSGSSSTVALVGDSHAAQYSTAMAAAAQDQGWQLRTMIRNGCPFTAAPLIIGGGVDHDCADANAITRDELLRLKPQLVVVSAMKPLGYQRALGWTWTSDAQVAQGYRQLWAPLVAAGIRVLVIRDLPYPDYVDPECVEQHGAGSAACSMPRSAAVDGQPDPQLQAARGMAGVTVLDLTDHFCNTQVCPGVVGNVLVYRDNHLTDTMSMSLIPALEHALVPLV